MEVSTTSSRQELPMTTKAITPLRQRMIEDMNSRKLCAHTQLQHLPEQVAKRLQVPLTEVRNGAEIRGIKRHNAHEIDALAARLGDPARRVDAAAIGIQQQRRHHGGIKRWLAVLAAVCAGDLRKVEIIAHQTQHKAGEMVLGHEVAHRRRQKQRLIDLPGAECLAHAGRQNLTRPSLASKIRLLLGQAPRALSRLSSRGDDAQAQAQGWGWWGGTAATQA